MLAGFAEYWTDAPPVNELVAAYLGVKGTGSEEAASDPAELFQMMPKV